MGVQGMEKRMNLVQERIGAAAEIERLVRKISVSPEQINAYLEKQGSAPIRQKVKLHGILLRPRVDLNALMVILPELDRELGRYGKTVRDLAEINMKYEGYIRKEQEMVAKMNRLEQVRITENFD